VTKQQHTQPFAEQNVSCDTYQLACSSNTSLINISWLHWPRDSLVNTQLNNCPHHTSVCLSVCLSVCGYIRLLMVTRWEWQLPLTTALMSLLTLSHCLPTPTLVMLLCWHHKLSVSPCQCCTAPMSLQRRHRRHDYEPDASLCLLPTCTHTHATQRHGSSHYSKLNYTKIQWVKSTLANSKG